MCVCQQTSISTSLPFPHRTMVGRNWLLSFCVKKRVPIGRRFLLNRTTDISLAKASSSTVITSPGKKDCLLYLFEYSYFLSLNNWDFPNIVISDANIPVNKHVKLKIYLLQLATLNTYSKLKLIPGFSIPLTHALTLNSLGWINPHALTIWCNSVG